MSNSIDGLVGRAQRLQQRVSGGGRREQYEREFAADAAAHAEVNKAILDERLQRVCAARYEPGQEPRIVGIMRDWPAGREELLAELEAGAAHTKEMYIQARMKGKGWKFNS